MHDNLVSSFLLTWVIFAPLVRRKTLLTVLLVQVTYGYTSATFSGRMPCAEIADAIVQTGRESLERARKLIHEKAEWGADVVYGDTDSLFVWLPGKTKENAFSIGYDMADKVTSTNVTPVKLKFEKVRWARRSLF